ncbi:MAG: hypothetical protein ACPGU1_13370 [Myxococcota bacterium]
MTHDNRSLLVALMALAFTACGTAADPVDTADTSSVASDADQVPSTDNLDTSGDEDAIGASTKDSEEATAAEDVELDPEDSEEAIAEDTAAAEDIAVEDAQSAEDIAAEDVAPADTGAADAVSEGTDTGPGQSTGDAGGEDDTATDGDAVEDAEAPSDVEADVEAIEDTEAPGEDITQEDIGGSGPACDPAGTWTLETTTAALPGEGCAPNGEPAQGPNTKTFTVTQNPDGSLVGVLPEVTEPIPEITVTQLPDEDCRFEFVVALSIYFPSLGGEPPSTAYLTYTYTVALADGGVHGSGTVYTATIFEDGEIQQECTEAITIGGGFVPLGG